MRNVRTQYPKSFRFEIVRVYLTGNHSYDELSKIYHVPILKGESVYRQERRFGSYNEAFEQIRRFIYFYNNLRLHYSIGLQTPNAVHEQTGEQKKMWKPKIYGRNDQNVRIYP